MSAVQQRRVVDDHRLAYVSEAPVNWCPGLGTVLANEEVTADGRSERGNFPVFKRNLKQWMMRITAYADRLLADLDTLDWPEPVRVMQRNWIGRSTGAHIDFPFGSSSIPFMRRGSRTWLSTTTSGCFTGWIRLGATSSSRRRHISVIRAAPSRFELRWSRHSGGGTS